MRKSTILLVDDEPLVLNSLKREFRKLDYHCLFATSAQDALEILGKKEVNVIVTDMRMPVMNGLELLKLVKKDYPDISRIVLSGYSQVPQVIATINKGDIFKYIPKPWDFHNEFLPAIEEAVAHNHMKLTQKALIDEYYDQKNLISEKIRTSIIKEEIFKLQNLNMIGMFQIKNNLSKIKDVSNSRNLEAAMLDCYLNLANNYLSLLPLYESDVFISHIIGHIQSYADEKGFNRPVIQVAGDLDKSIRVPSELIQFVANQIQRLLMDFSQKGKRTIVLTSKEGKDGFEVHFITKIFYQTNLEDPIGIEKDIMLVELQLKILAHILEDFNASLEFSSQNQATYIEYVIRSSQKG